jgi:hypothetical protein
MDLYISSLLLGATGLGVMALAGLGNHGHAPSAPTHGGAGGHAAGHSSWHHAGDLHALGHGHVSALSGGRAHAAHGPAGHHVLGHHSARGIGSKALWSITSPRFLFSFALGFGLTGQLLRSSLSGALLAAAAVAGAVAFERLLVTPLWNFTMRFASTPAQTLESAITDEATAVTAFDASGQGIVAIEVDGQIQQILATLKPDDRLLGTRVRAGQRLRIEDVDAERNRCTVTLL